MSGKAPRIGVVLPTRGVLLGAAGPPQAEMVLTMAERAEAIGCDSVWVGDSLTAKPRLEPLATLAAVAARTSRVRLGTAVLLAALRHPVLLAQTTATVDVLSGGRLVLGIGLGGAFTPAQRAEWEAAGVSHQQRAQRLEEILALLKELWSGREVTFRGEHFSLERVSLGFGPAQRPGVPVLLASHFGPGRERQYPRAARLADGMISITDSPEEFSQVRRQVLAAAATSGKDPATFPAVYYMTVNINPDAKAAREEADAWITQYYGVNIWGDRWGPFGGAEVVAGRILQYAAAGAGEVVLRFASFDQVRQMELLEREILPAMT